MIPMLARPLDLLFGPPEPDACMVAVIAGRTLDDAVWLAPVFSSCIANWHVNPGRPGEPEPLTWKRVAALVAGSPEPMRCVDCKTTIDVRGWSYNDDPGQGPSVHLCVPCRDARVAGRTAQ